MTNEFHLLQSWTPTQGKELTKRQAQRLLKKLKISKLTKFNTGEKGMFRKHRKQYCARLRLMQGREPRNPPANVPPATNHRQLDFKDENVSFAWNGMINTTII